MLFSLVTCFLFPVAIFNIFKKTIILLLWGRNRHCADYSQPVVPQSLGLSLAPRMCLGVAHTRFHVLACLSLLSPVLLFLLQPVPVFSPSSLPTFPLPWASCCACFTECRTLALSVLTHFIPAAIPFPLSFPSFPPAFRFSSLPSSSHLSLLHLPSHLFYSFCTLSSFHFFPHLHFQFHQFIFFGKQATFPSINPN